MNARFPSRPTSAQQVWDYSGHGERLACALVNRFDAQQLCAYRKIRVRLGEQTFRELLVEAMDTLSRPNGIDTPAAWLHWYLSGEEA